MAGNSHRMVSQSDEDGDRRDACPTLPATPSAWFLSAYFRLNGEDVRAGLPISQRKEAASSLQGPEARTRLKLKT